MKSLLSVLMGFALLLLSSTEGWSSRFCGEFYNERTWINCFGVATEPDGSKYAGEWKQGMYHGKGTLTFADGTVKRGIWKYGVLVRMTEKQKKTLDFTFLSGKDD